MDTERKFAGKTVLIVDDSDSVRKRLEATYSALGFQIVGSVADGVEAIGEFEKLRPDLVSLDIIMPVMDGIECYRKLTKLGCENCLFVSALGNDRNVIDAYQKEIASWRFVGKPVQSVQLIDALEVCFGFKQADVEASVDNEPAFVSQKGLATSEPYPPSIDDDDELDFEQDPIKQAN